VLPPWNNLYHWPNKNSIDQSQLEWSLFFDLESLRKYVLVIELQDLLDSPSGYKIDLVYYLKHDLSDLNVGEFNKVVFSNDSMCHDEWSYSRVKTCARNLIQVTLVIYFIQKDGSGIVTGRFWNYQKLIRGENLRCILFRGSNVYLGEKLLLTDQSSHSFMYAFKCIIFNLKRLIKYGIKECND
jgi:hypothetical protein